MDTLHKTGILQANQRISSTYVKTFFPNFEEVFGHHENLNIVLKSFSSPKIEIR